ncbi:MAG: single-stranded DNA-binding protein [candidate division WOR-3 bacterium]
MPIFINRVILAGNLTKDPEKRYTTGGTPVTTMRVAVNKRIKDREETCYIDVVAFGKLADVCFEMLSRGSNILVEGYLRYETWETDVGRRARHVVVADRVNFINLTKEKPMESLTKPEFDIDIEEEDEFPF